MPLQNSVHCTYAPTRFSSLYICPYKTQFTVHMPNTKLSSLYTCPYRTQFTVHMPLQNSVHCTYAPTKLSSLYICPYKTQFTVHMPLQNSVHCTYAPTRLSSLHICPDKTISSGTICAMTRGQFKLITLNPSNSTQIGCHDSRNQALRSYRSMTLSEFVTNKRNNHKALICNANVKHIGYTLNTADAKLKTRNRGQKTELTGRSPLRRQRSESDCSAIEEEQELEQEEEEE